MADTFTQTVAFTHEQVEAAVRRSPAAGTNVLAVRADGRVDMRLAAWPDRPPNTILVQRLTLDCENCAPTYTAVLPGPTVVDLSAVEPQVRAALGVPAGDPLRVDRVTVSVSDPHLVVNGVPVPLGG